MCGGFRHHVVVAASCGVLLPLTRLEMCTCYIQVALETGLQLSVALAMTLIYGVVTLATKLRARGGCPVVRCPVSSRCEVHVFYCIEQLFSVKVAWHSLAALLVCTLPPPVPCSTSSRHREDYGSMFVEVPGSPATVTANRAHSTTTVIPSALPVAPSGVDRRASSQLTFPRVHSASMEHHIHGGEDGAASTALLVGSAGCSDGALPPLRARLVTAAVNFGLTAYAVLTVGAVKALHCVHLPGTPPSERRLFIQGTLACDYGGWQAPYVVLGAMLVCTPMALPFLAAWARHPAGGAVRWGVRRALVEPYRDGAYWWEAVLMSQRLVRVVSCACCSCCSRRAVATH